MNHINYIVKVIILAFGVSSFSAEAKAKCGYSIAPDSVVVGWTAFKTTAKVGVSGVFKKIEVTGPKSSSTLEKLVKGLVVSIDLLSMDSSNPGRDATLAESFFKKLKLKTSGKIVSLDEKQKSAVLLLTFNGITQAIPVSFEVANDSEFKVIGSLNLLKFKSQEALDSIHNQCLELHKGPDGVSKTWDEVDLLIKAKIAKDCK